MRFKLFDSTEEMKRLLQNNQPRLVVADRQGICVVRKGDTLLAFKNECPHMGEGLSGGLVNYLNEIVCPLHAYKFNLANGEEENRRCGSLQFISVECENPEKAIYLSLT